MDAGIAELETARRLGEEVGPVDTLIVTSANLSYHLIVADRFDEAVAVATSGAAAARAHGVDRRFGAHFEAAAVDALFRAGRWDEAEPLVAAGRRRPAGGIGSVYQASVNARWLGARGDLSAARTIMEPLLELSTEDIDADVAAFIRLVDAELAIDEDRPDRASAAVTAGLARLADGDDTILVAPLCATGLRAAADRAERARALRRPLDIAAAEADGTALAERIDALWAVAEPSIVSARGYRSLCAAEARRPPRGWSPLRHGRSCRCRTRRRMPDSARPRRGSSPGRDRTPSGRWVSRPGLRGDSAPRRCWRRWTASHDGHA